MIRRLVLLLACCALAWSGEDLLPRAPEGRLELHGTFNGERFWARLNPPDQRFGGHRMLELVYTPPAAAAVAGAHLSDTPFLLLDDRLRLVALNGRDTLNRAEARADGYSVTREIEGRSIDDGDAAAVPDERTVPGARGWDERLAPVLLTLVWRNGARGEMPTVDLFGPPSAASSASWRDSQAVIAGRQVRITPDAAGRVARIDDAAGSAILTVTAWITAP
jgi:hypothetical protein